eukprot:3562470-Prorocentrum_lima.AAC.1
MARKRVCRFLPTAGRCIWRFPRQAEQKHLTTYSDSDWAGCQKTRRPTNCSMLFHGRHLIGARSTAQNAVALSSGES